MVESALVAAVKQKCDFFAGQGAVAGRAELPEFFKLLGQLVVSQHDQIRELQREVSELNRKVEGFQVID